MTEYLTAKNVRARFAGISEMTLWRWVKESDFPKPVMINRRRYFLSSEIDAYQKRIADARTFNSVGEAA